VAVVPEVAFLRSPSLAQRLPHRQAVAPAAASAAEAESQARLGGRVQAPAVAYLRSQKWQRGQRRRLRAPGEAAAAAAPLEEGAQGWRGRMEGGGEGEGEGTPFPTGGRKSEQPERKSSRYSQAAAAARPRTYEPVQVPVHQVALEAIAPQGQEQACSVVFAAKRSLRTRL